jgi:hypothetical protein
VWARWAPGGERARLATFAFSGSYAGTVVSMPLCSLLAAYTGWPGIFYVFGKRFAIHYVFSVQKRVYALAQVTLLRSPGGESFRPRASHFAQGQFIPRAARLATRFNTFSIIFLSKIFVSVCYWVLL